MGEKLIVPQQPADKPGVGGDKKDTPPKREKPAAREHPRGKMKFLDRHAIGYLTRGGRREIRQERSAAQREKESREHLSEPEALRKRLKEFDAALYYVGPQDKLVAALAQFIYKKARKLKLPKAGEEKEKFESDLADEARRYIFTGLIPRGEELVDALNPETKGMKSAKELRHLREINDRTVTRHLRAYLVWRWVEDDWRSRWETWLKGQKEKKEMPIIHPSGSFPKWQEEMNRWISVRNEHVRQKVTNEPPRPPSPPEQLLVVSIAKRLGEDHRTWKVEPIKPETAK